MKQRKPTIATSLTSDDCYSATQANELFATRQGLLVLRETKQYNLTMSFAIPTGCYSLVTRYGLDFDYMDASGQTHAVWPNGLHFPYPPWVGISYLITKRSTVLKLPVNACRTKDGVLVNVDVVLIFRIMGDPDLAEHSNLVRKFVYELGPRGFERQLRDTIRATIHALTQSLDHTEVYGIRSSIGEGLNSDIYINRPNANLGDDQNNRISNIPNASSDINKERKSNSIMLTRSVKNTSEDMSRKLNEQFNSRGVEIQSVSIKNVLLPKEIQSQMEEKALSISRKAEENLQDKKLESLYKKTDIELERKLHVFKEEQQREHQLGLEKINIEKVKLNDTIFNAKKSEGTIREQSRDSLTNIMITNQYEIQRVNDRKAENAALFATKSKGIIAKYAANTNFNNELRLAEAHVATTKNEAEVEKIMALTEGKTAALKKEERDFATNMKRLNLLEKIFDEPSPTSVVEKLDCSHNIYSSRQMNEYDSRQVNDLEESEKAHHFIFSGD